VSIVQETWDRFRALGREGELIERELGDHWDDLRFPVSAVNPPGAASDPDVDATDGTLLFDASATELVFVQVQMPHKWKHGSFISPHVHWCKTTSAAGTVSWQLEYRWAEIGAVLSAWSSADEATLQVSDGDTAEQHALSEFSEIIPPANRTSSMFLMKVSRVGSSDTYGADAKLLEFDIHYKIDSRGSDTEYVK
jgi:hypothetical protein